MTEVQLTPLEDLPSSVCVVPLPLETAKPPPPPQCTLQKLSVSSTPRGSIDAPTASQTLAVLPVCPVPSMNDDGDGTVCPVPSMQDNGPNSDFGLNGRNMVSGRSWTSEDETDFSQIKSIQSTQSKKSFDPGKHTKRIARSLTHLHIGDDHKKSLKKQVTNIFHNSAWSPKTNGNRRPSQEIVGNVLDEISTLHKPNKPKAPTEQSRKASLEPQDAPTQMTNFTIFSEEGNASTRMPTIRFLSPFGVWMDRLRIILSVWAIVYTPVFLAFEDLYVEASQHWAIKVVDVSCDLIFFFGVILALMTTVGSVSAGREYLSPNVILSKRLWSLSWWMDCLSCTPFLICLFAGEVPNPESSFCKSISWLKLLRIHWVISMPPSHFETRFMSSVQVFRMFLWICMSMHLMACLWYAVVLDNGTLERHLEGMAQRTSASDYLMAFKFGSYMVTGKPCDAFSDDELLMIAISSPLGGILFAFIYGNTTMLVTRMSIHMSKHHKHIALIRSTMRTLDIPVELRQRITKYHHFLAVHHNVNSYALLMQGLSVNLFIELKAHLFKKLFSEGPFFQGAPGGFLRSLVQVMVEVTFCPGDVIIRYGDLGDQMYFVVKGRLEVLSPTNLVIGKIQENMYFGEIALLISTPRLVSIRAATYCLLAMISRDRFIPILEAYPEQRQRMMESMKGYKNLQIQGDEDDGKTEGEDGQTEDAADELSDEAGDAKVEHFLYSEGGGSPKDAPSADADDNESRISPYASASASEPPVVSPVGSATGSKEQQDAHGDDEDIESHDTKSHDTKSHDTKSHDTIQKELHKMRTCPVSGDRLGGDRGSQSQGLAMRSVSSDRRGSKEKRGTSSVASQESVESDEGGAGKNRCSWESENHGVTDVMKSLITKRRISDLKGVGTALFGNRPHLQKRKSEVNIGLLKKGATERISEHPHELTTDELTEAVASGVMATALPTTTGFGGTTSSAEHRRSIRDHSSMAHSSQNSRRPSDTFANWDRKASMDRPVASPLPSPEQPCRSNHGNQGRGSAGKLLEPFQFRNPVYAPAPSPRMTSPLQFKEAGSHDTVPAHGYGTVLETLVMQPNGGQSENMKWSSATDLVLERIEDLSNMFSQRLGLVEGNIVRRVEERFDQPLKELIQRVDSLQRSVQDIQCSVDVTHQNSVGETYRAYGESEASGVQNRSAAILREEEA